MKLFYTLLLSIYGTIVFGQYDASLYEIYLEPDQLQIYDAPFSIDTVIDQRTHTFLGQNKNRGYSFYLRPSCAAAIQDFYRPLLPQKKDIPSYAFLIKNLEIKVVEDRKNEQLIIQTYLIVSVNDQEHTLNTLGKFPISKNKANAVQDFTKNLLRMMMQKILADFTSNG